MLKLGLQGMQGSIWDEADKTNIVQILISHQQSSINSIQFLYDLDGNYTLSNSFGSPTGLKFNTVVIDRPREFLISVSGGYLGGRLVEITFHTNKKMYGPFGGNFNPDSPAVEEFKYDFGPMCGNDQKCCFGGFHGTVSRGRVNAIGVYVKPLQPTPLLTEDDIPHEV